MDVLEQATRDLQSIVGGPMSRISAEVQEKEELWRFQRSLSPGVSFSFMRFIHRTTSGRQQAKYGVILASLGANDDIILC